MNRSWVPLSPGRRMVADLSWASLRVPRCAIAARLRVPRALSARGALAAPRPPWTAIFAKGFALLAENHPVLRQLHATLPGPRLLRLDHAIGCVMVERQHRDEPTLTLARFVQPHAMTLTELAAILEHAKTAPPEANKTFHRMLRFTQLPWPLRRLMMQVGLSFATPLARYAGSFAVSSLGAQGVQILESVNILPVLITYGPMDGEGGVDVCFIFDHRVMDGADGAMALRGIQEMIEGPVTDELNLMGRSA